MTRRNTNTVVLYVVVMFAIVSAFLGCCTMSSRNQMNADELQKSVTVGESVDSLIENLQSQGIAYNDDASQRRINALYDDKRFSMFSSTSYILSVYYDENRIVTRADIKREITGP